LSKEYKGRWYVTEMPEPHQAARRDLADKVREVIEQCLMTEVSQDVIEDATARIGDVLEDLKAVQGVPFREAIANGHYLANRIAYADRNSVIGKANPLAAPMDLSSEDEWAVGHVTLGRVYEGAPGFIHGGVVSMLFDQIFGSIMVREGVPGLTGELQIRYKKPTPVSVPLKLMARIKDINGRQYRCEGKLLHGGDVLVTGRALMVAVEGEQLRVLFEAAHGESEDEGSTPNKKGAA